MQDRNDEEGVAGVGDTGEGVVPNRCWSVSESVCTGKSSWNSPCQKGREKGKDSTGEEDGGVGIASGRDQVGDSEKQECEVEGEEEEEEGDGGP